MEDVYVRPNLISQIVMSRFQVKYVFSATFYTPTAHGSLAGCSNMAKSELSKPLNMATPCSVNAKGG